MTAAALKHAAPGADDPLGLAAWLAAEIGAAELVVAGTGPAELRSVARPADLASLADLATHLRGLA